MDLLCPILERVYALYCLVILDGIICWLCLFHVPNKFQVILAMKILTVQLLLFEGEFCFI